MTSLSPYLVFPGTCREAMQFYVEALNGEITSLQTFGDSPLDVPDDLQYRIFDCELSSGGITIRASDDLPGHPVTYGSNISLFVSFPDQETKKETFENLSTDGKVLFPIDDNFGMLKDKYGIQWMFVSE